MTPAEKPRSTEPSPDEPGAETKVAEKKSAETPTSPTPAPKKSTARRATAETPKPAASEKPVKETEKVPKAFRRPRLDAESVRLLRVRRELEIRRPRFVRQASHRYWRIGRWESWRRPRGVQSKQRRHYGYRSEIVKVGYRSPKAIRGRTPSGFLPVIVRTETDVERLDSHREAAVIARNVGTRRRLVLEEVARRRGIHVLNPLVRAEEET